MALGSADGKVIIDTHLNNKGFVKGVKNLTGQLGGLKSVVGKLGSVIASAFAVRAVVNFGKECIELGSNIAEVQNVVDVAFGDMSYKVEAFADTAIEQFGMSALAAKKTASTYMAMAKGMGLEEGAASDMAITLAGLTGDVASFYNISQELADTKLKSVFTGETETLKDLGVVMTQANLEAFALAQGISKDYDAMTQAEKVALRYNYVMDSLNLAVGDFARTSDSWANQTRVLSMQWEEFMSIMGQALITVLTPCVKVLNQIVSQLISVANAVSTVVSNMFGVQQNASDVSGAIGESVDNQNDLTNATEETAKAQKKLMAGFDEINVLGSGGGDTDESSSLAVAPVQITTSAEVSESAPVLQFFERLKEAVQPTIDAVGRLWEQLKNFGTFSGDTLAGFYNNFLVPVGTWMLGEGLPRFVDTIKNGLGAVNWESINGALVTLWDVLAPLAVNVGEGLVWFWENFLMPIRTWVANEVLLPFLGLITEAVSGVNTAVEGGKPLISWLWNDFLVPLGSWAANELMPCFIDTVKSGIEALGGVLETVKPMLVWLLNDFLAPIAACVVDEVLPEFLDLLQAGVGALSGVVETGQSFLVWLWEKFLQPVAEWTGGVIVDVLTGLADILDRVAEWIKTHQTAVENIAVAIGAFAAAWVLCNGAVTLWNAIGGIATAVTTAFGGAVALLTSPVTLVIAAIAALVAIVVLLVKNWDAVKETASKVWDGIKSVWSGVASWFKTKVIDPVVNGFKSFANGIIGFVEGIANGAIKGINNLIGALNKISFDIPEWIPVIGGKKFGFNLKEISEVKLPRLATGAVIPPNREFLAVLGDQKSGTNIEAPLSTIEQAVENVLRRQGGGNGEMTLVLDGDLAALARVFRPYILKEDKRVGVTIATK